MKRVLPLLFCLILAAFVITAGCVSEDTSKTAGPNWLFSDIAGTVAPETNVSLVDDFHAAANKEWFSTTQIPAGDLYTSSFYERYAQTREKFLELLNDTSITGHDADLLRTYYNAYLDMDKRNKDGIKPLETYAGKIEGISSLEDYGRYIAENGDSLLRSSVTIDFFNASRYTLMIQSPYLSLEDSAEYSNPTSSGTLKKEANAIFFKKMLLRLGYTQEQADKMEEDRMWLESQLASVMKTKLEQSNTAVYYGASVPYTIDELKAEAPNYPVDQVLSGYVKNGVMDVLVAEPAALKKLNELYTEENLEKFKAYLMYMYIDSYAEYLDQEALDIRDERQSIKYGTNYTSIPEKLAFSVLVSQLQLVADKFYAQHALDPKTKEDVLSMTRSMIDIYRDRLANATWLSDETRAKAIEKLDAIHIFALYPDDWSDYDFSSLSFDNCESLADMMHALEGFTKEKAYSIPGTLVDKNKWPNIISDLQPNAFYYQQANAINILAGFVGEPFYNESASIEKNYGGLGYIIGHEISHAFDSAGSQYDKDGNLKNWWTDEDRKSFNEKTQKVADYFSTIEAAPNAYVDGTLTLTEAVADLGGMSVILEAASRIDGFDYDTFFRSVAGVWKSYMSEDTLKYIMVSDTHPPGNVRTNAVVQQFDEFYDTYDVKSGDGMYLAPENRLSVW